MPFANKRLNFKDAKPKFWPDRLNIRFDSLLDTVLDMYTIFTTVLFFYK